MHFPANARNTGRKRREKGCCHGCGSRMTAAPAPKPLGASDRPGRNRLVTQKTAKLLRQLRGGAVTTSRFLFETLQAYGLEIIRDTRAEARRGNRFQFFDLANQFMNRFALERRPAGQQMIEQSAQRVDVDRRKNGVAPCLLGSPIFGTTKESDP